MNPRRIAARIAQRRLEAAGQNTFPPGGFRGLDEKIKRLELLAKGAIEVFNEAYLSRLFVDHPDPDKHSQGVRETREHLTVVSQTLANLIRLSTQVEQEVRHALLKLPPG